MIRNLRIILFVAFYFCFTPLSLRASQDSNIEKLLAMSLDELINIEIDTGTLTGISAFKVPVARTVITAADIAVTPARDIMDLLEVYVPGATFVNHEQGSRFGFRGIIGDQNFHYLLLVNGKNMNIKAAEGPLVEIFNRDLNDIQKIEIIRGPGSVSYGPGAIGGVINIITNNAKTSDGLKLGMEANHRYRYQNVYASYGKQNSKLSYYFYGSLNHSDGNENTRWYYVDRENGYGYGYMSPDWGNMNTGSPVTDYYGDALDKPQIKLHAGAVYNDWSLWTRYTSGSLYNMVEISRYQDGEDYQSQDWQDFAIELKNSHDFSEKWRLETKAGFDSFSYRQIWNWQGNARPQENLLQYANNYSENEFNLETLINYKHSKSYRFAAGIEYAYEYWEAPWGKDESQFLMMMPAPVNFATLTESSGFYQHYGSDIATVVNDLDTSTFSFFLEANMDFHRYAQLLLSGRADKNELYEWAYSPRIALITNITDNHVLKTVWQRSVRISNFPELYTANYENNPSPEPEILENYEIMFVHAKENFSWNANLYYNILDQVNWTGKGTSGTSAVTGQLKMWGFETEARIEKDFETIGANYSYIKQDSWKWLDESVKPTQNLTNDAGGTITIPEYADNRINNLPSHAVKVFWNHKWSRSFSTHLNARLNWDQNQKELLDEFLAAHVAGGTDETKAEMNAIYNDITDHGYGEPSFTMNVSGSWKLPTRLDATLTLYAANIISVNNTRYVIQYYENLNQEYPRKCSFIDEPTYVGLKLDINF